MKKTGLFLWIPILFISCGRSAVLPKEPPAGEIIQTDLGCLYFPSGYTPEKEYPLIVLLHGLGESDKVFLMLFSWIPQAEKRDYILCSVKSEKYYWDDSPGCRDIGNIHKFIKVVCREYPVRKDKIALLGWSNGGHFTNIMMLHNCPWWRGQPYINAFIEGSGGSSTEMDEHIHSGEIPSRLKVPVFFFWGEREVPHPGENVSRFLMEQGWDVTAAPHPGTHQIPDTYFDIFFDWLDEKIP